MNILDIENIKNIEKTNFYIIFRNGTAIGDHFLITSVIENIKKFYKREIIIYSVYPDLFLNNPNVYKVFNYNKTEKQIRSYLKSSKSKFILNFRYDWTLEKQKKSLVEWYTNSITNLSFKNCYPKIYLSEDENNRFKQKNNLPEKYCIIQSQGKLNHKVSQIKDWGVDNFQEVVNLTRNHIKWIQIGQEGEKKIKNVFLNLCGKTSLRELFYIINKSNLVLSIDGFLTHLAASFNIKNICILSPITYSELLPYKNIIHVSCYGDVNKHLICKKCFKWYCTCYKNTNWRKNIKPSDIAEIIKKNL
jgi:hypothetical protein